MAGEGQKALCYLLFSWTEAHKALDGLDRVAFDKLAVVAARVWSALHDRNAVSFRFPYELLPGKWGPGLTCELNDREGAPDFDWDGRSLLRGPAYLSRALRKPGELLTTLEIVRTTTRKGRGGLAVASAPVPEVIRGWLRDPSFLTADEARLLESLARVLCGLGEEQLVVFGPHWSSNATRRWIQYGFERWASKLVRGLMCIVRGCGAPEVAADARDHLRSAEGFADAAVEKAARQQGLQGAARAQIAASGAGADDQIVSDLIQRSWAKADDIWQPSGPVAQWAVMGPMMVLLSRWASRVVTWLASGRSGSMAELTTAAEEFLRAAADSRSGLERDPSARARLHQQEVRRNDAVWEAAVGKVEAASQSGSEVELQSVADELGRLLERVLRRPSESPWAEWLDDREPL